MADIAPQQLQNAQVQTEGATGNAPQGIQSSTSDFTDFAMQYRHELTDVAESIRQRAVASQQEISATINSMQTFIEPKTQKIYKAVTTLKGPSEATPRGVVQTFLWTSVTLSVAMLVAIPIGTFVLSPLTNVFIGKMGAMLLAYVALPIAASYALPKFVSEQEARFHLLLVAALQGLMISFVVHDSYLISQPLAALTTLIFAVAYPVTLSTMGASRATQLFTIAGAAIGINAIIGFVMVGLSASYILMTLGYTFTAATTLQLLHHTQAENQGTHQIQLVLLTSSLLVHGAIHLLMGSPAPPQTQ
ncbi:hypothetical protein WR25_08271 [Diploscapter pachys]|uniref:Uncharacterized protein n=1 Tax=Diploscapter pachys TaxID=2018661 RepID=A0A2A2LHQ9_9BILA|nr:hypothetical protein WR25_08271 [Diploscapter pachys]